MHAFSIVSGSAPRILFTGDRVRVALTIRNDGLEAWRPDAGTNFSYWWRSRTGDWREEGSRTDIPTPVPPGGVLTIDARLNAPETAGLYRLQWDMVQENVLWFSEQDPMPPDPALVVILPAAHAGFAVWPSTAILCVAWLLLRSRRLAAIGRRAPLIALIASSDVLWCVASLFTKQRAVLTEGDLPPDAGYAGVALSAAVLLPVALLIAVPRRWRPWASWIVALGGAVIVLSDLLYFRFFGDLISASALLAAPQTGRLWNEIRSLLRPSDAWLFADLLLAIPLIRALGRLPDSGAAERWTRRALVAASVLALVPGARAVSTAVRGDSNTLTKVFRNLFIVQDYGLFGYHAADTASFLTATLFKPPLDAVHAAAVRDWFRGRASVRAGVGPWFGTARGMNVLVVQVESMQQFLLGLRVGDQEITPTLNGWLKDSLWFSSVADQTGEGRTSDAEFVSLVSLLPIEHGAVAFRYGANRYEGFPRVLNRHGYHTVSAVAFDPDFWNRRIVHPAYGFSRSLFLRDFLPGEAIGWGLNDHDFLAQLVPVIAGLPQPFCMWAITLSLHHPFEVFPDHLKTLRLGRWEQTPFGSYLHAMRFFDRALADFVSALERQGLLNNTMVVVLGDHDAAFPWDQAISRAIGMANRPLNWYLLDRVPFVIRLPRSRGLAGERTMMAGQTDVPPTLLGLLGIDAAPLPYVGRNLLGEPGRTPVVRPFGAWVDDTHLFVAGGANRKHRTCYDIASRDSVPLEACHAGATEAARQREASDTVISYDLQTQLANP